MRQFTWSLTAHYTRPGPDFYTSDKLQYGTESYLLYCRAEVETRVNGPKTAFAKITFSVEWASNMTFGLDFNKHFFGTHAGQQARAWCNYLLNNPPSSWQTWNRDKKEGGLGQSERL